MPIDGVVASVLGCQAKRREFNFPPGQKSEENFVPPACARQLIYYELTQGRRAVEIVIKRIGRAPLYAEREKMKALTFYTHNDSFSST